MPAFGRIPAVGWSPAAVQALQRSAGNRAVAAMVLSRAPIAATETEIPDAVDPEPDLLPGTRGPAVELLQMKLNRHLGFMGKRLLVTDARFGPLTAAALTAVLRALGAGRSRDGGVDTDIWAALDGRPPDLPGRASAGGTGPEYARALSDGLLDITLAHGFDESGGDAEEIRELRRGLVEVRGFTPDPDLALQWLAAAGRPAVLVGEMLVLPRTDEQPFDVLIRWIPARQDDLDPNGNRRAEADADAAATRDAVLTGMDESDVFIYGGHARYGTGPDFDRNYTVRVDWDRMTIPRPSAALDSYDEKQEIAMIVDLRLGGSGRAGATRLRSLIASGAVSVEGYQQGNIGINDDAQVEPDTVGAVLMTEAARGQEHPLAERVTEDHYRLWLFNGCNTYTYERALRGSSDRFGTAQLDLIESNTTTPIAYTAESELSFIDGLIARESAAALTDRLNNAARAQRSYQAAGFEDNPVP
jgi:hypothetical protein